MIIIPDEPTSSENAIGPIYLYEEDQENTVLFLYLTSLERSYKLDGAKSGLTFFFFFPTLLNNNVCICVNESCNMCLKCYKVFNRTYTYSI